MVNDLRTNYIFIDYENVQIKSLSLLASDKFKVLLFLGPNNTKLPVELVIAMQNLGNRAQYITLDTSGNNALDFYIAFYLGNVAVTDPTAFLCVVSKDTGFDPLIQHLKSKKISCVRSISIEAMPCFDSPINTAQSISEEPPTTKKSSAQKKVTQSELMIKNVLEDLNHRGESRPRTVKTLRSTIKAKLGKLTTEENITLVFNALVKKNHVQINGNSISYLK